MKFAKELEQDLVPEWRIKYLNYKAGKKYVKSVSRAIAKSNGTPHSYGRRGELPPRSTPGSIQNQLSPRSAVHGADDGLGEPAAAGKKAVASEPIPVRTERQSLTKSPGNENYGSFVPTPVSQSPLAQAKAAFELPAPAMRVPTNRTEPAPPPHDGHGQLPSRTALQRSATTAAGRQPPGYSPATPPRPQRPNLTSTQSSSARLRRLFSNGAVHEGHEPDAVGLQALDTVRQREREFFTFLDAELEKVEAFYKLKEEQAGKRLAVLKEQLHEMRNRRSQELAEYKRRKDRENGESDGDDGPKQTREGSHAWIDPIKAKIFKPGPNSKALIKMPTTPVFSTNARPDTHRDYTRRPHDDHVPYRTAKRKLKLALQEFYRGLELLKSYTLLNRTAFRKLNKKYDKAANARPPYRYMNERVNKSWFVTSDLLDAHLVAVEDLYARYFEKGNHKIAAGKLRRLSRGPRDVSGSTFVNGLFVGTGAVFAIQGLTYGVELLFDPDPTVRTHTSYLLQIYGGYFLMLYLFFLFCGNCYVWTKNKINYTFIFELDPRHNLDWRQLSEFPCFCLFLLGIFIWLNFTRYGSPAMFLYYPVLLIFLTTAFVFLPAPVLGHKSRQWFVYSHYRLLFAGLFPVEFRDFFLGDMYCSLTYAMSNIELFFCLYANYWNDPAQCNSNHSRLLGFFNTLPPVWRALQCIRRYLDTKNVFPHLVNLGKYTMTILSAVALSLYRIEEGTSHLALYATFSVVNGIYCSVWDLLMDFSLLQPDSRHVFLRDILALKRRWLYYVIMVIDPILRFSWIFYAIYTHNTQHSTAMSFFVSFAEVSRRGMWALLRVENEHCSNVAQYKASRDVPLPYNLEHEPLVERISAESTGTLEQASDEAADATDNRLGATTSAQRADTLPADIPAAATGSATADESGRLRRRRKSDIRSGGESIRRIMAEAHKQDFEKKRRPAEPPKDDGTGADDMPIDEVDEDDDDDDDDDGSALEERMAVRRAETLGRDSH